MKHFHFHDEILSFFIFSPRSIGNLFSWGPVATDNYYHRETRFSQGVLSNITVRQPMDSIKALRKLNIPVIIGLSYVRYIGSNYLFFCNFFSFFPY